MLKKFLNEYRCTAALSTLDYSVLQSVTKRKHDNREWKWRSFVLKPITPTIGGWRSINK